VTEVGMKPMTSWTVDWYTNYWTMGAGVRVSHIKYTIFLHSTLYQFCFLSSELQIRVSENGVCYFVEHAHFSFIVLPCFSLLVRWKKGGNVVSFLNLWSMKIVFLWNVVLHSLEELHWHFRRIWCFIHTYVYRYIH
jgi:hypothetical protein